jgi:hypothetical protein
MPQYISLNGQKYVQLDDGDTVPVNVSLSLDGGTLVKLPTAQLTALQTPTFPASFPLPSTQVTDLKAVTVGNFPTGFNVSNFPSSYNVSNLPSTYPLPNAQEVILSDLRTRVQGFDLGSGILTPNTLRTTFATDQPRLQVLQPVATMTPISVSSAGDNTLISPAAGKALRITGIAITLPSLASIQLRQGTVAQGQTNLTGVMSVSDWLADFSREVALAADKSLVLNLGAAINARGYVTYWEA